MSRVASPPEQDSRAAEAEVRSLVEGLFPTSKEEAVEAVEDRHVLVFAAETGFAKTAEEKQKQKNREAVLCSLASEDYRRRCGIDDFSSAQVDPHFVASLNRHWRGRISGMVGPRSAGPVFVEAKRLEWHGAEIVVSSARNPRLVGVKGVIFATTPSAFWLLDENGKKWRIDKAGTDFAVIVAGRVANVSGSTVFAKDIREGRRQQRRETKRRRSKAKEKRTVC